MHNKELFNEYLYEYQQVLKYEEFQYEDFPQVLDMGPDYLAWIDWVECEMKLGKRISYEEYRTLTKQCPNEYLAERIGE